MSKQKTSEEEEIKPIRRLLIIDAITYSHDTIDNFEHPSGQSLTVPDMAMTLQQIMEKYTQGGQILGHEPQFFDDEFPDVSKMDFFELQEAIEATQSELAEMQRLQSLRDKAADQAKLDAGNNPEPTPVVVPEPKVQP